MTIARYGRGACRVCGREFNLTSKGFPRVHVNLNEPAFAGHMYCKGAALPARAAEPAEAEAQNATPAPAATFANRRRRLEADIADAKKSLNRAQARFDGLCDELAALRREEREQ